MKFLINIVSILDHFLSPDMRKLDSRDLVRVRFLVFAILFSIPCNFILASLLLLWNKGDTIWLYGALTNAVVSGSLLWQLHRTQNFRRPAAISLVWMHAIFVFILLAFPGILSFAYLWASFLIFFSSLIFGMRAAFISCLSVSALSVGNILYRHYQGDPWISMSLEVYTEQLILQLSASTFLMALVTGLYEFMRDMNEQQQARQRLLTARHAQSGAVGELVGHVAHEVNNPLAILQASVTRLRRIVERQDWIHEGRKLLDNMQRSYERIIRVQQSLAIFASGNQHEPFVSSDVRSLLKDVQLAMRPQAQAQQVQLEFKDESANSSIRCQPHQLVYVLCSLIQNALDASRDHPNPSIRVDVASDGVSLHIAVTDNGRGIDPAQQERIFQPFFTTKTGGNAQGLSLSVSRGIMAEHGGAIHFNSQNGVTIFTCQIPLEQSPAVRLKKGA